MNYLKPCPVVFSECGSNQAYNVDYEFIYNLPFVPQINQVYLVTLQDQNSGEYIQSCFYISRYNYSLLNVNLCKIVAEFWDLISISPSSFGLKDGVGCDNCILSVPTYWQVSECISGTVYIVSLPTGTDFKSYGITFTIDTLGIDLYCGIIGSRINYSPPTAFVSSIIGFIGADPESQSIFCEECVASGATKVLIQNCLDGHQEVIWGSNLFNPGDVSNISLGGGSCYEIISATTAPVTINELLNYEPSPTCTDCLNCEQVELTIVGVSDTCEVIGVEVSFISNQYVPVGSFISNGFRCSQVLNVSPVDPFPGNPTHISFPSFEVCQDCIDASFQRWVGTSCNDGHQDIITLTGTSFYVPGQIVQVQRNGSDFICYELNINLESSDELPDTPNFYYSLTETPFNTCAECSSGSTVGITIIDCDYASASYITVSLNDYLRLTGNDGDTATPVLQYEGKCHLLLNECPIDNTYPLVTSTLYNNCIECTADLNLTRYSGTTCFSQEPINIIYTETNILTPGTIILTNNGTCVTISGITELTNTEGTITTTGLTSCYECYLNDNPGYYVFFQSCLDGEIFPILLSSIGLLPLLGVTYFLDFTIGGKPIQSCFTVVGLQPSSRVNTVLNSISVPYVDCEECYTNNLIRYIVKDCVSGDIHVIGYPSTGVVGLVTYTPISEVDQYCGSIEGITTSDPIDSSLITILGKVECEDCLSAVAKKRILTNCLTGNQEVVWGSLLFTEGNITHIQTGEGCYEIGPETELEVTINEFLDFDNYPSCQECIQCNGVHYFYSACTPNYNITSISSTSPAGYYTYLQVFDQANNILWFTDGGVILVKFDVLSQTVINSYSLGVQPQGFLFLHPTNNKIYFKNGATLRSFDTVTIVVNLVYTSPYGGDFGDYYYDPTTDKIWLPNFYTTVIIVFNLTTTVSQVISLPYSYPKPITYNPNNNKIYVVDYNYSYFYVIDRTTLNVDSVNFMSSNSQSDVIFYENSTNRVFGKNFYIDCSTNTSYNTNIYILYDIIQDPTTGYLISPSSSEYLYIIDPVNLTSSQSSIISSAGYYISYNSSTNQFYLTTNYYNTILTVSLGDVYNIGEIDSYQYAPLDSYFFHPRYGCSVIYDILPSSGVTSHSFYSFENFDTCEDCTNVQFDVFEAYNCVTNRFGFVTTQAGLYTQDDLVNVKWGETDFVCYRLDYLIPPSQITNYDYINSRDNFIADSSVKPTCENCSDGTNVAISIIDCSNQNSMFINVSLSVWFILTGYNDTIPRPVFLFGDTCYKVLNECPFSPDHYTFNPTYIYFNCESCGNPLEANSETVLCLQNCSGGTYTVSVNHPYWTNQYGMAVIQNNAVGLGGPSGYNG